MSVLAQTTLSRRDDTFTGYGEVTGDASGGLAKIVFWFPRAAWPLDVTAAGYADTASLFRELAVYQSGGPSHDLPVVIAAGALEQVGTPSPFPVGCLSDIWQSGAGAISFEWGNSNGVNYQASIFGHLQAPGKRHIKVPSIAAPVVEDRMLDAPGAVVMGRPTLREEAVRRKRSIIDFIRRRKMR